MPHSRKRKNESTKKGVKHRYTYRQRKIIMGDCDKYSDKYSMNDICNYLQNGGGGLSTHRLSSRSYTNKLITEFIRKGWRPEFVHTTFRRMYDDLLDTPIHIFIREFSKAAMRRLDDIETSNSITQSLIHVGLRSEIAEHLENIVQPLVGSSYTDIQVLDTAILYLLGHYTPITPPNTTHLIHSNTINMWLNYTRDEKSLSIINVPYNCSTHIISQFKDIITALRRPSIGEHIIQFHTTSWEGSLSIMEGVDRMYGRPCLDFGIYRGFYISHTIEDCIDWGYKHRGVWSNEVAIMIFAVPKIIPSSLRFKELEGDEWTTVTKHSRECKDKTDLKIIKGIDILYGNMVSNSKNVFYGRELPQPHKEPKKQLVSKTDAGDKFIHSCLIGCVYFQKWLMKK